MVFPSHGRWYPRSPFVDPFDPFPSPSHPRIGVCDVGRLQHYKRLSPRCWSLSRWFNGSAKMAGLLDKWVKNHGIVRPRPLDSHFIANSWILPNMFGGLIPGRVVQTYITSDRDFASDQNLASDGTFGTFCAIPPTQFPIPSMPVALEFVWRAWLLCLWHCPLQLPIHPSRALQFSPEVPGSTFRTSPTPSRRMGAKKTHESTLRPKYCFL